MAAWPPFEHSGSCKRLLRMGFEIAQQSREQARTEFQIGIEHEKVGPRHRAALWLCARPKPMFLSLTVNVPIAACSISADVPSRLALSKKDSSHLTSVCRRRESRKPGRQCWLL